MPTTLHSYTKDPVHRLQGFMQEPAGLGKAIQPDRFGFDD